MKRTKLVAVVAAAAMVGTFAASGVAGARVRTDARGVTSDTITVGGLTDSQQPEAAAGAKAALDAANDAGGVNGRKFDYLGGNDDKGDVSQSLALGKKLVQQDGVFAVVPVVSPNAASAEQFFLQQKVPFFGWGINTGFYNNQYGFGFSGAVVPPPPVTTAGSTWGDLISQLYKNDGDSSGAKGKSAAVIAEDNDSGKTGVQVIGASAKYAGMKLSYQKASIPAPPATVGDYSPYVNDIMTANNGKPVDVVFVVTSFSNVLGLSKALLTAGFTGILTNAVAYDARVVSAASGQTVFTQFSLPEAAPDNPNMQKVVDTLEKYLPSDQAITQGVLAGYFSADFFVKAVKKAGKNLTPQSLQKAASKFTYQIKDVIGPTPFPDAFKFGTPCGALAQSDGTAYKVAVPYACYTNINLKTLKPISQK
ncbi:MAG: ABC transporter substrate-binding protein [Acidimicrobiia bacterium]|nr:ABC transporter substrate-binding protein [Acidimicrobiia bacterium]